MSEELPAWLEVKGNDVVLHLFVQPRASRTKVVGPHGEPARLKVAVAAPPVDNEANEAILYFFRKLLKIPSSRLELVGGATSRSKNIRIQSMAPTLLLEMLGISS